MKIDLVGVKGIRVGLVPDVPLQSQNFQCWQRELEVGPQVLSNQDRHNCLQNNVILFWKIADF
jgi:hypothetical protein